MKSRRMCLFLVLCACSTWQLAKGSDAIRKLKSIRAAEESARRSLIETLKGVKITSTAQAFLLADVITGQFEIETEVDVDFSHVKYLESSYDHDADIAAVVAEVGREDIERILGRKLTVAIQSIRRIGFGTSSTGGAAHIQALRAAEVDAYRQLAEYLNGLEVTGNTTVRDYVVEYADVRADFVSTLYGAQHDQNDPYGFIDNTAYVNLFIPKSSVDNGLNLTSQNLAGIAVKGLASIKQK